LDGLIDGMEVLKHFHPLALGFKETLRIEALKWLTVKLKKDRSWLHGSGSFPC
jgi:hypothetical protein